MSKRTFDEMSSAELLERDLAGDRPAQAAPAIIKNSLDSDEEDDGDEKNYDILADDDIEGKFSSLHYYQYALVTLSEVIRLTHCHFKTSLCVIFNLTFIRKVGIVSKNV